MFVSARYTAPDGKVTTMDSTALHAVKMLSARTVAYVTTRGNGEFYAAGSGTYEVAGDRYHERLRASSVPAMVGKVYSFTFRRDGDDWQIAGLEDGTHIEERWHRIE